MTRKSTAIDNLGPAASIGVQPGEAVRRHRLLDKTAAAEYLSTSTKTIERLIHTGGIPTVKLPVERARNGEGRVGASRRVLIDVRDLDLLIDSSKERSR